MIFTARPDTVVFSRLPELTCSCNSSVLGLLRGLFQCNSTGESNHVRRALDSEEDRSAKWLSLRVSERDVDVVLFPVVDRNARRHRERHSDRDGSPGFELLVYVDKEINERKVVATGLLICEAQIAASLPGLLSVV